MTCPAVRKCPLILMKLKNKKYLLVCDQLHKQVYRQ